ncbi:hypothetical protein [Wohlfahrtiimonas larvae]|uniref:Uncharacterized protein n=1 Tax=Wohlfahrtiimonas larvae TaxID=1157986 RepID=A0ABP9MW89_9GAMM|nr:hypothetical protein [Wohlfahrtiimonas larvae]
MKIEKERTMKQHHIKEQLTVPTKVVKENIFEDHKRIMTIFIIIGTLLLFSMTVFAFFGTQLNHTIKIIYLCIIPVIIILSWLLNQWLQRKMITKELHYKELLKK